MYQANVPMNDKLETVVHIQYNQFQETVAQTGKTNGAFMFTPVDVEKYLFGLGVPFDEVSKCICQLIRARIDGSLSGPAIWGTVVNFIENFIETRPDMAEKAYSLLHNLISSNMESKDITIDCILGITKYKLNPDPHWSLMNTDSNFQPLKHCNGAQLYFKKLRPLKADKCAIYIMQTAGQENAPDTATLAPVLQGKISNDLRIAFRTAVVNEKSQKLYLIFAVNKVTVNFPGSELIKVNGYDLKRGPLDQLGYRRSNAVNSKWWTFQLTGHYGGVSSTSDPETLTFVSHSIINTTVTQFLSLVHFGQKSAIVKDTYRQRVNSYFMPDVEEADDGKKLFLVYKPGYLANTDLFDDETNLQSKTAFTSIFEVDPINKPHFKLISSTEVDHITFLKNLLPVQYKQSISDKYGTKIPSAELIKFARTIGTNQQISIQFVGIMFKYLLFTYDESAMIAVKYRDSGSGFRNNINITTYLYWPSQLDIETSFVSNTHVVYKLLDSKKRAHMLRYNLAPLLKDYRRCANCQKAEQNKRRKKGTKRIAFFKVCRLCKERNFHLNWKKYPCHYCSIECMKSHWKTHKEIHKRKRLVRQ